MAGVWKTVSMCFEVFQQLICRRYNFSSPDTGHDIATVGTLLCPNPVPEWSEESVCSYLSMHII